MHSPLGTLAGVLMCPALYRTGGCRFRRTRLRRRGRWRDGSGHNRRRCLGSWRRNQGWRRRRGRIGRWGGWLKWRRTRMGRNGLGVLPHHGRDFTHYLSLRGHRIFIPSIEHTHSRAAAPVEVLAYHHVIQSRRRVLEDGDIQALLGARAPPEQIWIRIGPHHLADGGRRGECGSRLDGGDEELGRGFVWPLDRTLPSGRGHGTSREHHREQCERKYLVHFVFPAHIRLTPTRATIAEDHDCIGVRDRDCDCLVPAERRCQG
ncbi:hypothetical protein MEBOL_006082 [Melittangium boletus DSM 14713]|uniref:Uncharacterized protein n=1 Tax=Melittangium boletus DSM 14713 TaxID=1294270 RepID=A0A250ILH0_9BACT|nr:hypothetical protein MEBOL_006082 [Melittangium boletus DSM 14713]